MTIFRSTARTLGRLVENAGRSRARRALLALSERSLADAGFSRTLLERGNEAWPWRIEAGEPAAPLARPLPPSRIVTGAPIPFSAVSVNGAHDAWREEIRDVA